MEWGFGKGGGEELWFQSQEDQELSATVTGQLILKMSSEEHTNFENSDEKVNVFVQTLD